MSQEILGRRQRGNRHKFLKFPPEKTEDCAFLLLLLCVVLAVVIVVVAAAPPALLLLFRPAASSVKAAIERQLT